MDINHAFHLYYNVVCGSSFSRSQPDFEGFLRALRFPPSAKLTPSLNSICRTPLITVQCTEGLSWVNIWIIILLLLRFMSLDKYLGGHLSLTNEWRTEREKRKEERAWEQVTIKIKHNWACDYKYCVIRIGSAKAVLWLRLLKERHPRTWITEERFSDASLWVQNYGCREVKCKRPITKQVNSANASSNVVHKRSPTISVH